MAKRPHVVNEAEALSTLNMRVLPQESSITSRAPSDILASLVLRDAQRIQDQGIRFTTHLRAMEGRSYLQWDEERHAGGGMARKNQGGMC